LPTSPAPRYGGSIAAAISDAVVGLLREYTGRGPTRVPITLAVFLLHPRDSDIPMTTNTAPMQ
jgi:hypothetical protein